MSRWRALLLYVALSVPFGIAVHLASEFAGLGRDADDLVFSPLHAYLGLLALTALAGFLVGGGFLRSTGERRRRIGLMAGALPFRGRGPGFFAFSAILQFAFFVITQLGEGCPLCNGDVFVGVLAALVASLIGSFALIELRRRIVRLVGYAVTLKRVLPTCSVRNRPRQGLRAVASVFSTFAVTLAKRPPPAPLQA